MAFTVSRVGWFGLCFVGLVSCRVVFGVYGVMFWLCPVFVVWGCLLAVLLLVFSCIGG